MTAVQQRNNAHFHPRRLGHTNLYVSDLNRAMDFYINIIGIEETYRTPLRGGGFVSNGNTHHDIGFIDVNGPLGKARGAKPGRLNHLGFELESELELVNSYEAAIRSGQKLGRTADHDVVHSVYGADPEGHVYELYADIVKDWRSQRSGIVTKPKPDWTPRSTPPVEEACYHESPEIRQVETAPFHPLRTTHACLAVQDLPALIDHYTSVVGLDVLYRDPDDVYATLGGTCGELSLTLVSAVGRQPGLLHTGLVVRSDEDLDRSVARARSMGASAEIDLSHAGRRSVLIRDPDGLHVQLYHDVNPQPDYKNIDPGLAGYLL